MHINNCITFKTLRNTSMQSVFFCLFFILLCCQTTHLANHLSTQALYLIPLSMVEIRDKLQCKGGE